MLIRNYGLFWRREDVFWGRKNNPGHLKGIPANSTKTPPTDFRNQIGLYALYDDNFSLVYFGQAGRGNGHKLFARLKDHTHDHIADRWSRFSWFGTKFVKKDCNLSSEKENFSAKKEEVLDQMEAVVIAVSEPPHNRQGGRFGSAVDQYLQVRDEDRLGLTTKQMIEHLYENHKNGLT